ncbi:hypothetical protein ACN08Z_07195 [Rothia sp. P7181]|uniref:hypothetical protein n=1 Tax=unclassified Rothia (in: high G+C Gram-positive bacteria) TaxID=2689056 RepID=UPI003AD175E4
MENILTIRFEDDAIAYKALSELRSNAPTYRVLVGGVVVVENGKVTAKDGFNYDSSVQSNWAFGGIIGAAIGMWGGPIGLLLYGGAGALAGSMIDSTGAVKEARLFDKVTRSLAVDGTVLVLLAQESDDLLDKYLQGLGAVDVQRDSVAEVQASILQAEKARKELEKQAQKELHEQKREEFRQKAHEKHEEVKEKFHHFFSHTSHDKDSAKSSE